VRATYNTSRGRISPAGCAFLPYEAYTICALVLEFITAFRKLVDMKKADGKYFSKYWWVSNELTMHGQQTSEHTVHVTTIMNLNHGGI